MKRRAELEAQTRRRITESAVELHGTLGPARTSMSAVAEHAGVRRSTVYRHFPDEAALFGACQPTGRSQPAAGPRPLGADRGPGRAPATALGELYAYYRRTEQMLDNLLRDEHAVPLVAERFAAYHQFLATPPTSSPRGRGLRGTPPRTRAAIGHALAFRTWQALAEDRPRRRAGRRPDGAPGRRRRLASRSWEGTKELNRRLSQKPRPSGGSGYAKTRSGPSASTSPRALPSATS